MKKNRNILGIPLNRIFALLLLDIMAVIVASFAAIFVRFEFSFKSIPAEYMKIYEHILPYTIALTIFFFFIWKLYKSVWRYASATEMVNIAFATTCAAIAQIVVCFALDQKMPRSYYVLYWFFLFGLTCVIRFSYRILRIFNSKRSSIVGGNAKINVMVIGAGAAGNAILKEIESSQYVNLKVKCIIDDQPGAMASFCGEFPL